MDARTIARITAAGRIGIGIALFAAPATSGRLWFSRDLGTAGQTALRGLGARDVAIGVGSLLALDDDGDASGWIDAGIVADAADTAAILLAAKDLDRKPVVGTVVVAAGAALLGLWTKSRLS